MIAKTSLERSRHTVPLTACIFYLVAVEGCSRFRKTWSGPLLILRTVHELEPRTRRPIAPDLIGLISGSGIPAFDF
jgi:hypothetical protein